MYFRCYYSKRNDVNQIVGSYREQKQWTDVTDVF